MKHVDDAVMPNGVARGGQRASYGQRRAAAEVLHLTEVERAVVEHLATGDCSKEIAVKLQRSRATIEFHVRTLFVKLNARSRAHIVARAYSTGLLRTEPHADSEMAG